MNHAVIDPTFYLNHVRDMRQAGCLALASGESADHLLHMRLLCEEQGEYVKACADNSQRSKADALGDIVVVACGYQLDAGEHAMIDLQAIIADAERAARRDDINLAGAFLLIHESNMSKLCREDQLEPTRLKYAEQGIEVEFRQAGEGLWSPFAATTNGTIPVGKWLKGSGYHEPDWSREMIWQM